MTASRSRAACRAATCSWPARRSSSRRGRTWRSMPRPRHRAGARPMILSDTAIKKPVLTVVAMLGLVIFGLYALLKLDVDEFPDISSPIVFVAIPYPGASPGQVERDVVDRLEEQFSSISGIDEVN